MNPVKFEANKTYAYGNSSMTVVKRTEKTLTTLGGSKVGIEVINGVEVTKKVANRSHVARADSKSAQISA